MHDRKETKRFREVNWTSEEKECLRKAVIPYISIIEDKLNDAATIARKNKAWEKVQKTMLAAGYDREVDKMRQGWARMKLASRQSKSAEDMVAEANEGMADTYVTEYNMTAMSSVDGESTSANNMIPFKLEEQIEEQKSTKRVRENNWSAREKAYLRECIDSHISIIEDKANDNVTIKKKREAWNQIRAQMLTKGYNRNPRRIRQQWMRMKLAARKAEMKTDLEMSEMSSADSDDMYFESMMGAELEEDPILVPKNLLEHNQEQIEEEKSSSNELHRLQVELLRSQIQHQRTLEHNQKELHALKMKNERELHSLKLELISEQISAQRRATSSQVDPNLEEATNGQLWN